MSGGRSDSGVSSSGRGKANAKKKLSRAVRQGSAKKAARVRSGVNGKVKKQRSISKKKAASLERLKTFEAQRLAGVAKLGV